MTASLEDILKYESWHRSDLRYKLHAGQRLIYKRLDENTHKLFVANCSRQWGKSYLMATRAIEQCLKKPKSKVKYATGTMAALSEFIIPTFNLVLEDCPRDLKPVFKHGNKFTFPNGSEIFLIGLDKNPDALRGNTIDMIILDEVAFMKNVDSLYHSVIMPATLHRPNAKIIMISTPPESLAHDFVEFVNMAKIKGNYACFTIYDNPMLTPEQIAIAMEEAGGANSTAWKREFLCLFVTEEKKMVVQEWEAVKDECIVSFDKTKDEFYDFHKKYIGMDVGVKDFTAGIFAHYNFAKSTLYVEDEFRLNDKDVTPLNIANTIKTKRTNLWGAKTQYTGICDIDKLLINALNLNHKETFHPVSKRTLIEMVARVRNMVKNKQIIIDPKCKHLTGCMESAIWDAGSLQTQEYKKFARSKAYGHFDHLAALIYLVMGLDRATNPIPTNYGVDLSRIVIQNPDKYDDIRQSIKNFQKLITPKWKKK